jgi:hypothetical protein
LDLNIEPYEQILEAAFLQIMLGNRGLYTGAQQQMIQMADCAVAQIPVEEVTSNRGHVVSNISTCIAISFGSLITNRHMIQHQC